MKSSRIAFCFLLFTIKGLLAQDSLDIYLDYNEFYENDNFSFVEIYYSIARASLKHVSSDSEHVAEYATKLNIYSKDSLLKSIDNKIADKVELLEVITPAMWITDLYQLLLKKGTFKIEFTITDLNTKSVRKKTIDIAISGAKTSLFFLSDIQLALDIKRVSTKSRFTKNSYQITPNPSQIYNIKLPVLFYYSEIYKSSTNDSLDSCYVISEIIDLNGNEIKTINSQKKNVNDTGIIEINKALVSSLKSGSYYLVINLTDGNNHVYDSKKKLFFVFREIDYLKQQSVAVSSQNELLHRYEAFTEAEIDKEFEQAEYIATSTEEDIFEDLDFEAKKKFMVQFWESRKHLSSAKNNNFRAEYLQRIEYANGRFTSFGKDGWEKDRGRIILKYGIPDDMERFFGGNENIQYEVWTYNELEGHVQFFFVDVSRYGTYRLVHSTMLNEINDFEWRNRYLK
jgi:GWxTD domain-containing protein